MTKQQIDHMRHALGVQLRGGEWTKPYRNHFVAGEDDRASWDELVARGYAEQRSAGDELTGGFPVYKVTDAGRAIALAGIVEPAP